MAALKTHLKRGVALYLPVTATLGAIVTLIAVDLARDFQAWWAPAPPKVAEAPQDNEAEEPPTNAPEEETEKPETGEVTVLDEKTGKKARISYTTFFVLSHKGFDVVTGKRYDTGGDQPDHEYCYAAKGALFSNTITQVGLARKDRDKEPSFTKVSKSEAHPFGVSAAEMMGLARTHCRFTEEEAVHRPESVPQPRFRLRQNGERDA